MRTVWLWADCVKNKPKRADAHYRVFLGIEEVIKNLNWISERVNNKTLEKKWMAGNKCDGLYMMFFNKRAPYRVLRQLIKEVKWIIQGFEDYKGLLIDHNWCSKAGKKAYLIVNFEYEKLHSFGKIKNLEKKLNMYHKIWMLNLNVIKYRGILNDWAGNEKIWNNRNIIYWGSCRSKRLERLIHFVNDPRIYISVDTKEIDLYVKNGINKCKFVGCLDVWNNGVFEDRFQNYDAGLYLEDEITSEGMYNYLATRFYEALEFGLGMFFDIKCKKTVNRAVAEEEYIIDNWWFVESVDELYEKLYSSEFVKKKKEFLDKNRLIVEKVKADVMKKLNNIFIEIDSGG